MRMILEEPLDILRSKRELGFAALNESRGEERCEGLEAKQDLDIDPAFDWRR